jgi:hypothetical protein
MRGLGDWQGGIQNSEYRIQSTEFRRSREKAKARHSKVRILNAK